MADISSLTGLQAGEPLEGDQYPDAKEAAPPPPKGRYQVMAPSSFPSTAFGATKAGLLKVAVDGTIAGPTNQGYQIRFQEVSAKTFKRAGKNVSQAGDYIKACGLQPPTSPDPQVIADAIEATAGRIYQIDGDWEAYDSETKWQLKGMENFPRLENGGHNPWVTVPGAVDAQTGDPKQVRARFRVQRYVTAA